MSTLVRLLEGKEAERAAIEADLAAVVRQAPVVVPTAPRYVGGSRPSSPTWRHLLTKEVAGERQVLRWAVGLPTGRIGDGGLPVLRFEG